MAADRDICNLGVQGRYLKGAERVAKPCRLHATVETPETPTVTRSGTRGHLTILNAVLTCRFISCHTKKKCRLV